MPNDKIENASNIIIKKRGRKSKKEIEELKKQQLSNNECSNDAECNITIELEEVETQNAIVVDNLIKTINNEELLDHNEISDINEQTKMNVGGKPLPKKRGRKPKGGKIIQQVVSSTNVNEPKPNVILHLKCSLKDLKTDNFFTHIDGYSFSNFNCRVINNEPFRVIKNSEYNDDVVSDTDDIEMEKQKDHDVKEIGRKLKMLQHDLHINNVTNKKSACFWDTCEFDNPPVYIPKYFMNNTYHVYGCFCSPECAVAHLMEENIDSSIKFERYQMMNHIYSKIYNFKKNIKPAPNPYYMLEKYCGNLTTQEYRSLLSNERLFLVVDKPLTRVMPELHEDNDDFIINNKIIPTNNIKNNIKLRQIQKKTKTNVLSERFGLT